MNATRNSTWPNHLPVVIRRWIQAHRKNFKRTPKIQAHSKPKHLTSSQRRDAALLRLTARNKDGLESISIANIAVILEALTVIHGSLRKELHKRCLEPASSLSHSGNCNLKIPAETLKQKTILFKLIGIGRNRFPAVEELYFTSKGANHVGAKHV
jgi:hypothetical protein